MPSIVPTISRAPVAAKLCPPLLAGVALSAARGGRTLPALERPPVKAISRYMVAISLLVGCAGGPSQGSSTEKFLQQESDHFILHYTAPDQPCISDMLSVLEANYAKVAADLEVVGDGEKTDIDVYPDIDAFHVAIGQPSAPAWNVGQAVSPTLVRVTSPLHPGPEHTYASIMKVAVHEFVHTREMRVSDTSQWPPWLSEGVACYEAGQSADETIKDDRSGAPTLDAISDRSTFVQNDGYAWSYYVVRFILDTFGKDALVRLMQSGGDISSLNVSYEDFNSRWQSYIRDLPL